MASQLFDFKDVKNNPTRSGFDRGNKVCATAKAGELLPFYWCWINPGDTVRYGVQHITRTRPINTAAFVRMKEYFDWFYVPISLLWKSFPTMITKMDNNPVQASSMSSNVNPTEDTPYLMLSDLVAYKTAGSNNPNEVFNTGVMKNQFGFERGYLWAKLASHLGYFRMVDALVDKYKTLGGKNYTPLFQDTPVSIFPLAAYHKIYNDFYRFEQWEKATPFLWNFDYSQGGLLTVPSQGSDPTYWQGTTLFDLHYANWNKDLFMGLLPNQQYGDAAAIDASIPAGMTFTTSGSDTVQNLANSNLKVVLDHRGTLSKNITGTTAGVSKPTAVSLSVDANGTQMTAAPLRVTGSLHVNGQQGTIKANELSTQFTVIALRQAEALQRWKEIAQAGDQTYRDQIYRHFGISLPEELSDLCQYVGGDSSMISISDVVNQSFNDPESVADIKGKGVGTGGFQKERTFKQHGILMCVYHCKPLLDYDLPAIDPQLTKTNYSDFFIPEFDRIGMEELPSWYLLNGTDTFDTEPAEREPFTLGYSPRYYDYKTSIDRVLGAFRDTLSSWVAPINSRYLTNPASSALVDITYNFFKVNPLVLDPIFSGTIEKTTSTENPFEGAVKELDSTCASDQFWINAYCEVKMVRNMDYDGVPY